MLSNNDIRNIVTHVLLEKDSQLFLVDLSVSSTKAGHKIIIYIDGDRGVPIDVFVEVSRAVSATLDEEDLIEDPYTLEVSSPGLDQPLKSERQYRKNVGREIKITLQDDAIVQGKLLQITADEITIGEEVKKETTERIIPFDQIKKTNVLASFK